MIRWIGEWIWVRFAYTHGKWCEGGRYCPILMKNDEGITLVRFSFPMSESALQKLMCRWKFREITGDQLQTIRKNVTPSTAPFLEYEIVAPHLPKDPQEIDASFYFGPVLSTVILTGIPLLVLLLQCIVEWINK